MNTLQHIVEPTGLLLTWQPTEEHAISRTRRVVGEVRLEDGHAVFRYMKGTADYVEAEKCGFKGFPAFDTKNNEIRQGVIESFMRRLPPSNRDDFPNYLEQHRLPVPFRNSEMALLGYTGARLPSDGFALVPEFPPDTVPCDFLLEVAGVRHVYKIDINNIHIGDEVTFERDMKNSVDSDALLVVHHGQPIGYVNRAVMNIFHHWLQFHNVQSSVERINGKPGRPLVYLRVSVT